MKRYLYLIITLVLVVIFIIFFLLYRKNNYNVLYVSSSSVANTIEDDGFAIIFNGEISDDMKKILRNFNEEYLAECYYSDFTLEELETLATDNEVATEFESEDVFLFYVEGKLVDIVTVDKEYEDIVELIEKYLFNKIPESERYYQVLSTAEEYIKKVNSKNYTVAVFGMNDCTYCDLYLPVINDIARDNSINIYYFNKDEYDEDEYEEIMELDFEIPAKCTTTGYSTTMSQNFPKPMTLITKSGKLVDCIRGYVTMDTVLEMLKEYKIIKES